MRKGTPHLSALPRAIDLLERVIEDGGASNVSTLARAAGIPVATAHRHIATLVSANLLAPAGRGRHVAGGRLMQLSRKLDIGGIVANHAGPLLDALAVRSGGIAQLGTFENDMVTYRLKTGRGAAELFTKVGMQLEAYCSGIGKMLLASLPEAQRDAYLAGGPFVPLTPHTITQPEALRRELTLTSARGYALDNEEVSEGLRCIAAPVRSPDGNVCAAISVSRQVRARAPVADDHLLALVLETAAAIEAKAFRPAAPHA